MGTPGLPGPAPRGQQERARDLGRLRYGDELAQRVWPNDPLVDP